MNASKPYQIPKRLVWEAFQEVRSKKGAGGVDEESLEDFEGDLKNNLYRIWNRMSSGSYFPPPVRAVSIPKKSGGTRVLGVPTVADRVAQTVAKMVLEPMLEPIFDVDSYGYRPGRSAHDAIAVTRKRCWKFDWVVEFDIKGLFDYLDHELLMKALRHHCDCPWVILYVERWLKVPLQDPDGTLKERACGTPQGGVVSPVLSNLFLHYAFDAWMRRTLPDVPFCRYADDGLAHCRSRREATSVLKMVRDRFAEVGLELHPGKSGTVYCKDKDRRKEHEAVSFTFLGYTFRPRSARNQQGRIRPNFLPAVSRASRKAMNREMRSWHIQLRTDKTIQDLSRMFDPILQGWKQYYGRFYPSELRRIWISFNNYLVRWVQRKYRRFAKHKCRARDFLVRLARSNRELFVHWRAGCFTWA